MQTFFSVRLIRNEFKESMGYKRLTAAKRIMPYYIFQILVIVTLSYQTFLQIRGGQDQYRTAFQNQRLIVHASLIDHQLHIAACY